MSTEKTTYSKDELVKNLTAYDLVVVYLDDLSPIVLEGKNFEKIANPGFLGFAFKKEDKEIHGIYWIRKGNSYDIYRLVETKEFSNYFIHQYFLSIVPRISGNQLCKFSRLLDTLKGEE